MAKYPTSCVRALGGAVVTLTSSDPTVAPAPATVSLPAGIAFTQFQFQLGAVSTPTPVTLAATLNGASTSVSFTVEPPTIQAVTIEPTSTLIGSVPDQSAALRWRTDVQLNGPAPAGGLVVNLASDPAAANVPATATIAAGTSSVAVNIATSAVTTATPATISASVDGGAAVQAPLTLEPPQPPASVALGVSTTTGTNGANGTVTLGTAALANNTQVQLSSSNPAVASVPAVLYFSQGALTAGFFVSTHAVTASTTVTLTAAAAGITQTTTLTVNPVPPQPLAAPTLLAPANGARLNVGQTAAFDWSDVSGAASYTIQISTSSSFASTVVNQGVTPSQFATAALPKATLYWRVRATDAAGTAGAWSAARSFRVN